MNLKKMGLLLVVLGLAAPSFGGYQLESDQFWGLLVRGTDNLDNEYQRLSDQLDLMEEAMARGDVNLNDVKPVVCASHDKLQNAAGAILAPLVQVRRMVLGSLQFVNNPEAQQSFREHLAAVYGIHLKIGATDIPDLSGLSYFANFFSGAMMYSTAKVFRANVASYGFCNPELEFSNDNDFGLTKTGSDDLKGYKANLDKAHAALQIVRNQALDTRPNQPVVVDMKISAFYMIQTAIQQKLKANPLDQIPYLTVTKDKMYAPTVAH